MKRVVVLTGAGISAESGLQTFRGKGGLWGKYNTQELATPEAWEKNPELVLEFYNMRRKLLFEVSPNPAHYALVKLENKFDVQIITQNVDDLHERAGSKNVLHLHGELKKARSTVDPNLIYELKSWKLKIGDLCEKGSQLRPDVVWFGEAVPNIAPAMKISSLADIYIVIGTSLNVYPAAGLLNYAPFNIPKYLVDPKPSNSQNIHNLTIISKKAAKGIPELVENLLKLH